VKYRKGLIHALIYLSMMQSSNNFHTERTLIETEPKQLTDEEIEKIKAEILSKRKNKKGAKHKN
jgi:hypothetical protein